MVDDGDNADDEQPENEQQVVEPPPQPEVRRSTRERQPSQRYSSNEFVLLSDGGEPECFDEAMSHEHSKEWYNAM